jgi:DNA topoisomerase-1
MASKCVVIVESAAKATTITKYLKAIYPHRTWKVLACFGHVRDLPTKTLGIDTVSWELTYENLSNKRDVIKRLRAAVSDADTVYIASDPDHEGHAIAYHLKIVLKVSDRKCIRVTFNEITERALRDAFNEPSGFDNPKVAAQETRRALDRLVGYKVSPLLWKNIQGKTSAGRVQSAALAMVQTRYDHFLSHDPLKSWKIVVQFSIGGSKIVNASEQSNAQYETIEEARVHMVIISALLDKENEWMTEYTTKTSRKGPALPFTTSSLQHEAYAHHRFNAKSTMAMAQALYEEGYITYMRTDSTYLSKDFVSSVRAYVDAMYGNEYVGQSVSTEHSEHSEHKEAHEGIRPTNVNTLTTNISFKSHKLTDAHVKLYALIWKRAVASQMSHAVYKDIHMIFTHKNEKYVFVGKVSLLTFAGHLRLYGTEVEQEKELSAWTRTLEHKSPATLEDAEATCSVTKPKLLYTETDLIKAMEKNGIGRPSTYVSIIEKLLTKGYVIRGSGPQKTVELEHISARTGTKTGSIVIGGTDKDRLVPQELGIQIFQYMTSFLPDLLDTKFTSDMEESLDKVSSGILSKQEVLTQFYVPFAKKLELLTNTSTFAKWLGRQPTDADIKVFETLPLSIYDEDERLIGYLVDCVEFSTGTGAHAPRKKLDAACWPQVLDGTVTWETLCSCIRS